MNVAIVGWGVEPEVSGGMDIHVSRVAEALALSGTNVRLFLPAFNSCEGYSKKVSVEKIGTGPVPHDLAEVISSVRRFNEKIYSTLNGADFDVIHTHDWLGAEAGVLAKKKLGKKWVHTVHSLEYMRRAELNPGNSPMEELERTAILESDEAITVSRLMQAEILKKYKRNVRVIYNAPSVSAAAPDVRREENRVFFAGRLAEQKGLKYMLYSAKRVLEEVPGAKFAVAGEGHLAEPLLSFSKSIGIDGSIVFLGFVGKDELVREYQKATLFVSPSVFEPFGITVLDAAVLGAPIVATKRTGALELFGHGSVAVVKPEDPSDLAEKIIILLRDKNMRDKMAKKAKKDVQMAQGWTEIAKSIESAFSI